MAARGACRGSVDQADATVAAAVVLPARFNGWGRKRVKKDHQIPGERVSQVAVGVALVLALLFVAWLVSNAMRGTTPPDVTPPEGMVDPGGRAPEPGSPDDGSEGTP
jgi:hypothetical protein